MLLPILILAVRLTFFMLSSGVTLIIAGIFCFIPIFGALLIPVFLIVIPPFVVTKLYKITLIWFDSQTLPDWLPGKKYLTWKVNQRKSQARTYWLKKMVKHPASFNEGLLTFFITLSMTSGVLIYLLLATGIASSRGFYLGSQFAAHLSKTWFTGIFILYGIATFIEWIINKKKFKS